MTNLPTYETITEPSINANWRGNMKLSELQRFARIAIFVENAAFESMIYARDRVDNALFDEWDQRRKSVANIRNDIENAICAVENSSRYDEPINVDLFNAVRNAMNALNDWPAPPSVSAYHVAMLSVDAA